MTKSIALTTGRFEDRLSFCRGYLEHYFGSNATKAENFTAVELGTGWYPVVPIGLFLCGASELWTYNIAPLLRTTRVKQTLRFFANHAEKGDLQKHLPRLVPERLTAIRKALDTDDREPSAALLRMFNIHARVQDAQETSLPDATIDLFFSTAVLEYIPRRILVNIFNEFRRLARPGALMSHFINLEDEFCLFDHSITPFNFLKYSDRSWKWLDSPITRKNRLRISDYREILQDTKWQIISEENTSGSRAQLEKLRLAPQFRKYSQPDLLVLQSWIVARQRNAP